MHLLRLHQHTWYVALNSHAAVFVQIGDYPGAIDARIYGSRALAKRFMANPCDNTIQQACWIDETLYQQAIDNFSQAIREIKKTPDARAAVQYHLLRGYARQVLGQFSDQARTELGNALDDYRKF